jgi:GT2 family glycosyltransferase
MDLTILVLSCRRVTLLERVLPATRTHFESVERDVHPRWVCFDNGSAPEDQRRLGALGFDLLILSNKNLGQGPALNQLFAAVRTEHFLLLEDDWLLENPRKLPFVREAASILRADESLGQIKLDAVHDTSFENREIYDGPFQASNSGARYYVQNPDTQWGGFCCPPALTRTSAVREVGQFREDQPFRRWWAESEYCRRFASRYFVAKSPDMLLFRHLGDEPSPGWKDAE